MQTNFSLTQLADPNIAEATSEKVIFEYPQPENATDIDPFTDPIREVRGHVRASQPALSLVEGSLQQSDEHYVETVLRGCGLAKISRVVFSAQTSQPEM